MAATRIIPMHVNKGRTLAKCLKDRVDYVKDKDKTEDGEYISSYACDVRTAEEEFTLSKKEYLKLTGRNPKGDIIAYQVRQSFKPGEIDAKEANEIGYELAMKLTKGRHAFLVCTHTDKAHIHNHIIWNSTDLDCTRKYRNIIGSYRVVERLSNQLSLQHGLSVIKPYENAKTGTFKGFEKKKTNRETLIEAIDRALGRDPQSFNELLLLLEAEGYEVKRGKHTACKATDKERFIRLDSLSDGYKEEDLKSLFSDNKGPKKTNEKGFDLLIDIQKKLAEGKGKGYENWARVFNVKQVTETLIFLHEQGVRDYGELSKRAESSTKHFNELRDTIKKCEKRLDEIKELKKHIFNYVDTKDTYEAYKRSGYSKKFYEENRDKIELHKAAKEAFGKLSKEGKKIPTVKALNEEYVKVLNEKKEAYKEFKEAKENMKRYITAKANVDEFLKKAESEKAKTHKKDKDQTR